MNLTNKPMPWDSHPLAPKPYVVERETYVKDVDGGASYEGERLARFDTAAQAIEWAKRMTGQIAVYEMRRTPGQSGEHGGSIAKLYGGKVRWIDERFKQEIAA